MTEEFLELMNKVNGTWQNNFKVYFSNNETDLLLEKDIREDIRGILNERNTINSETDKVATEVSKSIITHKDMEDEGFNAFVNNIMRNPNPEHYLKLIADICYICKKDEQDACINGAYAYLKQQMPLDGNEIMGKLMETYLYDRIKFLKMTAMQLQKIFNDSEFIDVLRKIPPQFQITKSKLKGWVYHGLQRLERKATNMLSNYEKYLYNSNYHSKFPQTPLGNI